MARRSTSRRRSFNLRKVRVASSLAVGALATLDVISADLTAAVTDPLRVVSVDCSYNIADLAAFIDDGQEFGLAHSDYTDAEIEECIEAFNSIDLGNKIAQEQANRLVRTVGFFQAGGVSTDSSLSFNNGRPMKTKLNWRLSIGDSIRIWIRNGSDTVYTTGSNLLVVGNAWVKDV